MITGSEINIKNHDMTGRIKIIESDLFENLTNSKFDLIVSNPPYVDKQDLLSINEPKLLHSSQKVMIVTANMSSQKFKLMIYLYLNTDIICYI